MEPIAAYTKELLSKSIRTFHDPTRIKYLLPTDLEGIILQMQLIFTLDVYKSVYIETNRLIKLFSAPITKQLENGIRVLDAGCGPGCWSLDMAVKYKNSQFYGVDVLETQFPQDSDKPTNTGFVLGDLADNIPYPRDTFDFIYQRLLSLAFTKEQWKQNLKELERVLKPGGYLELTELQYNHREKLEYGPSFKRQQEAGIYVDKHQESEYSHNVQVEKYQISRGFKEISKSVKQQTFCSSKKASKDIEFTGDAILCAFSSLGTGLSEIVPEWQDSSVYETQLQNCRLEALANNAQLYCTIHIARK
ncbi:methyltransferase type 11 [Mucor ambiguus]|uniref:Methyltransferase type 11 n=1 Tax=Mucor ambiguus TaxID=91626 RepID=A0A0C9MGG9_9FUNG|nr:methyltransferase type 11 [Mucor ambiguus]